MTLWQEIQPFLDKETGLLGAPDSGRDNLPLFTALLIRDMRRLGEDALAIRIRLYEFLRASEIKAGLYKRRPDYVGDNSADNLKAAAYISGLLAADIAFRWDRYHACFDVERPEWVGIGKHWYGRFIGMKALIDAARLQTPSLWQRTLWSLATIFSAYFVKDAGNLQLQSLECSLMAKHGFCKRACRIFWKRHDLAQIYLAYGYPEGHPMVKYAGMVK